MSKINQEEYEVLKGLDDRWKWVARDGNGRLHVYDQKPKKTTSEWALARNYYLYLGDEPLQFIQWEDEEAHSITELMEGCKRGKTEVKKQELIENIKSLARETSQQWPHEEMVELTDVLREIDRLDELEISPQGDVINIVLDDLKEYIKEQQSLSQNVGMAHTPAGNDTHYRQYDYVLECIDEYEPSDDLQSLVVPKREKVKVPRFMADYLPQAKQDTDLKGVIYDAVLDDGLVSWVEEYYWIRENLETFIRAWLYGFEVEKEPLYRARLKVVTYKGIAAYLRTQSSSAEERLKALEIGSKYIHEDYRHLSEFTEEELKGLNIWDSDQWEIEEVEE